MKIAILGFAGQGQSAYDYWRLGNDITIRDKDPDVKLPAGASSELGSDYLKNLDQFDLLLRTPALQKIADAFGAKVIQPEQPVITQLKKVLKLTL